MHGGNYFFRSTVLQWAQEKQWLTADGLKIGPYTVDEALDAAESGALFAFAEAVRQMPALLHPVSSRQCGVGHSSATDCHLRSSFGTTNDYCNNSDPIAQRIGASPAGKPRSCHPSPDAVTLLYRTLATVPTAADGTPVATAAQRVFNSRRAVAAIVRARHDDESTQVDSRLSIHTREPPEWRYSFSSMMRINKFFFGEVSRWVWSTITDVNNLTSVLWQFEPSAWRDLPQNLQFDYLSGRYTAEQIKMDVDASRSVHHFHFYGGLIRVLHVGAGELLMPALLSPGLSEVSRTLGMVPFAQLTELHWTIGIPRNRFCNLVAFASSPLTVLVLDIIVAPEDSASYQYMENLLRYAGSSLRHLREVHFVRRAVGTDVVVPASVLRHLRSLSLLALHVDVKDQKISVGGGLPAGPEELEMTWTLGTDVQAIVNNVDTTRLRRLRMRLEGPGQERRLRDVRILLHPPTCNLAHFELTTSSEVSTSGGSERFHIAFAPLLSCSRLQIVKVNLPDMSFRFDIRSLKALFLSWLKIRTLHLSFQPVEPGSRIDIRHVFDVVGTETVSLHLPYLHTTPVHGFWFALPQVRTSLVELSSDDLSLQHSIIDIAWELSIRTKVSKAAIEGDRPLAQWGCLYALVESVKSRDLSAQAVWFTQNENTALRHLSRKMIVAYLDVAAAWPREHFVEEEVWGPMV